MTIDPKFNNGQVVYSKVDNRKMIVAEYVITDKDILYRCRYWDDNRCVYTLDTFSDYEILKNLSKNMLGFKK